MERVPRPERPELPRLVDAWRALPPRQARLLALRHLEGGTLADCARHYGISEEACAVHLARAAGALLHGLGPASPDEPPDDAQEQDRAVALEAALERDPASPSAAPPSFGDARSPLLALLGSVRADPAAISAALHAAELAEARSPARRREERLRLLAIAALVLLALFFGLRRG